MGSMYGVELAPKEDSRGAPVPMVSITWVKRGDCNGAPAPARGHYNPMLYMPICCDALQWQSSNVVDLFSSPCHLKSGCVQMPVCTGQHDPCRARSP